ncbi:hypothetical protein MANES_05G184350v8 [Manihot esculenta]|uniref:Uncharacterized protein n=1 Tax=Manihot esculenta TaxID=3983 RepID=A0ACB7HQD9_MANES|nr:hypothetical protein MANES_05G184350v8 [Manihot esculenta]
MCLCMLEPWVYIWFLSSSSSCFGLADVRSCSKGLLFGLNIRFKPFFFSFFFGVFIVAPLSPAGVTMQEAAPVLSGSSSGQVLGFGSRGSRWASVGFLFSFFS